MKLYPVNKTWQSLVLVLVVLLLIAIIWLIAFNGYVSLYTWYRVECLGPDAQKRLGFTSGTYGPQEYFVFKSIREDSPLYKAGIRPGDIALSAYQDKGYLIPYSKGDFMFANIHEHIGKELTIYFITPEQLQRFTDTSPSDSIDLRHAQVATIMVPGNAT